jgi:hypothetical protein
MILGPLIGGPVCYQTKPNENVSAVGTDVPVALMAATA